MIPRGYRVPLGLWKDILNPSTKGKYYNSPHFSLKVVSADGNKPRFAVSVSKKVSKKAVIRNRIRRRTYSVLGKKLTQVKPNTYLFSAKKGAENARGAELESEMGQILSDYLVR